MPTETPSTAATMKLVGGDPTLDFVNTVGGRVHAGSRSSVRRDNRPPSMVVVRDNRPPSMVVVRDKLAGYGDLVAWALHAGLLGPGDARALLALARRRPREARSVLRRAERLREALYRVLRALMDGGRPAAADLALVNAELAAVRARDRLRAGDKGLEWRPPAVGSALDSVLGPVARAASALLTSGELGRLRQCGGGGCGWLFLDRSRNRSRQWCTMEDCGNVSKVRRFRQRQRRRRRTEEA